MHANERCDLYVLVKVLIERDPGPSIRSLGGLIEAAPGGTMFSVH